MTTPTRGKVKKFCLNTKKVASSPLRACREPNKYEERMLKPFIGNQPLIPEAYASRMKTDVSIAQAMLGRLRREGFVSVTNDEYGNRLYRKLPPAENLPIARNAPSASNERYQEEVTVPSGVAAQVNSSQAWADQQFAAAVAV